MFNVIIYGDKDFNNYDLLEEKCKYYLGDKVKKKIPITIIAGNSDGFDELVRKFAEKYSIDLELYPLDWKTYGKTASLQQCNSMLNRGHALICFGCEARACVEMMKEAKLRQIPVKKVCY
jgi:hypothetical protein